MAGRSHNTSVAGRPRAAVAVVALIALLATTACTSSAKAGWSAPGGNGAGNGSTPDPSGDPPAARLDLALTPASDAKDVSPIEPVRVALASGTLTTVSLRNAEGKEIKGQLDGSGRSWQSDTELGYGKTYTITVEGKTDDGRDAIQESTFTTVKPRNLTLPYLRANMNTLLGTGRTYGVGQPVVVWFDEPIKDKAAAEKQLTVTTEPQVEGAWHWFDDREAHWRPQNYWKSGTKVTVTAKVYGHNLGGGLYGQQDVSASFTVGRSKVAIADSATKRMKVYVDGKQVTSVGGRDITAGIPISMGKNGTEKTPDGKTVDWRTYSGVHVVTTKHDEYRMTSASYGITDKKSPNYYDEKIKKSIRISGDGEFVHLRDWNVGQIGRQNTSHGCINVGVRHIYWFYDTFGAGDIVDVKGTNRHLDVRNGLGDWVLSWEEWRKGSALS